MENRYLTLMLIALLVSFNVFSLPVLNSLPAASATIYLDFDGHKVDCAYWNNGTPFTCDPAGMSDAQIIEVYNRVAEDYRPFDINITTDSTQFLKAPLSTRIRIVITPTSSWFPGVGGASFVGSFTWGDDTPAFVFSDRLGPKSAKMVAECCSHESGHAVGLSHQSKYDGTCNLTATYNDGEGTGEASWAPIMGNSYYRNMSGWNNGPTPYGCSNNQDNLSIITTQNGFGYRLDDYSDDIGSSPREFKIAGGKVEGIISTNTDKDAFTFTLAQNSVIHLDIRPFSVDDNYQGANLDVKMFLYNASRVLIKTFDPAETMNVVVDTLLAKGTYYMLVDGTGNGNVDDYGSLGSYAISASAVDLLPLKIATLTGEAANSMHSLSWNILCGEAIASVSIESSADGIHFNAINNAGGNCRKYAYVPFQKTDLYYRIRFNSVANQAIYSNIIKLKEVNRSAKTFMVATFIRQEIIINAAENYHYQLSDVSGNTIAVGKGKTGFNKADINRLPGGMYVLSLFGDIHRQTERIIKQ